MKSAGKARNNGLYRHIRTSKEIIRNLLNDYIKNRCSTDHSEYCIGFFVYLLELRYALWHTHSVRPFSDKQKSGAQTANKRLSVPHFLQMQF